MVAALVAPASGAGLVGGRDISTLSEREAAQYRLSELGFIRQSFDLLPGVSTLDNAVLKLLKSVPWRDAHERIAPPLEGLRLRKRPRPPAGTLSMGEAP